LVGYLKFRVTLDDPTGLALSFPSQFLRLNGSFMPRYSQVIPLETARPYLGGIRFWFVCDCGRRVGRLYLPFRQPAFRCRHCYNLTYQSAQEHDKCKDAIRKALAYSLPLSTGLALLGSGCIKTAT